MQTLNSEQKDFHHGGEKFNMNPENTKSPHAVKDSFKLSQSLLSAPKRRTAFGTKLRELRIERGLTQTDMAREAGLKSASTLSSLERGVSFPYGNTRAKIEAFFGQELPGNGNRRPMRVSKRGVMTPAKEAALAKARATKLALHGHAQPEPKNGLKLTRTLVVLVREYGIEDVSTALSFIIELKGALDGV